MKVEIIYGNHAFNLQNIINDFIEDKRVIDIKYTTVNANFSTALIMYEEGSK